MALRPSVFETDLSTNFNTPARECRSDDAELLCKYTKTAAI
jgi:hypothetical protein